MNNKDRSTRRKVSKTRKTSSRPPKGKRQPRSNSQRRLTRKVVRDQKSRPNKLTAPRTGKQYFDMPREFQEIWDRIVQVPARMRSGKISLPKAAREFGVRPYLVRQLASTAFRKLPNGRYIAKAVDRLLRILPIPLKKGLIEIALRDSRQASLIGEYWNAVDRYLSRGDASELRKFRRVRITDADGKRIRLLTNLEELRRQGSAGVLRFEDLYGEGRLEWRSRYLPATRELLIEGWW